VPGMRKDKQTTWKSEKKDLRREFKREKTKKVNSGIFDVEKSALGAIPRPTE
jgi:hypothetical protein